jgi:hypothetical protein
MDYTIFDIETDGLLEEVTTVHCLNAQVWSKGDMTAAVALTDKESIISFLQVQPLLVGHNIICYDLPVLKKLYGYTHTGPCFDTLPISWYLFPNEKEHGLEKWGESLGVPKPIIEDWQNLTLEEYQHRCSTDVKINVLVFHLFVDKLVQIYQAPISPIMTYLTWKMECLAEQHDCPLYVDRKICETELAKLLVILEERTRILSEYMPPTLVYKTKTKPAKMFTVKGDLTKAGEAWYELLADNNLELDFEGEIKVLKETIPPKPSSVIQLKAWLSTLGWEPTIFDYKKNTAGEIRAIPQLQDKNTKELCPNIKRLAETHESVKVLKGLFMLQHRKGVFEGFLECSSAQGKMVASAGGLTNTLRFKHRKPINIAVGYKQL